MTYINGGTNEIGVALTESWAAVWTVDTPYIDVIRRDFWNEYTEEIKAEAVRGRGFSDESGQTGCVAAIGTNGDLNDSGFPLGHGGDPDEYVASELSDWTRTDGGVYERAVAGGYSR
jgi:hypothetical protein